MSNDTARLQDRVGRFVAHQLLSTRHWTDKFAADIAATSRGMKVLEIGSGRQDLGVDAYSVKKYFADAGEFVQSDVNPDFGYRVVDITDMSIDETFDLIICMNVLEHVFDVHTAVENLRRGLRPGGRLLVAVPFLYPYHDEPSDFWRFTEHSLRELLRGFTTVDLRWRGMRRFPKGLLAIATR
ncbi:MAG: Methyltransferase type 11 [Blastococcus sp.]|nr:Methyltransferase type 11 [Blastococcus sp.]